ncbi:hypothetical protein NUW58_g1764 [Xylaria curta]|uniref:Uncharacterized protein n=1 Tax=Xylaria curta TaxID=42375 RepID=A0ACC1PIU8_9PEZI|nr:hypothetical protein NUW58_g1764 [Xylaria curta]
MDALSPQHIQGLIQAAVDNASATLTGQFNAEIDKLRAQITALQSAAASRKPRPVLPDPPLLTGPAEFDVWLPLLLGKLRVDGDAIGTDEAKFMYVYGRLDWKVQQIVRPQLSHTQFNEWDYTQVTSALSRIYNDPNKIVRASRKLRSMKMKDDDSIRTFLTNWEKYSWEAGTTVQPDILRIQDLRAAISNKLQGKVDDREFLPEVYDDFVALLLRLGGGYGNYVAGSHGNTSNKPGSTYPSTSNTSTPMDISQVRIDSIRVQPPFDSDTQPEAKVQISSIWTPKGQMATSSTRKERSERLKRGDCERCGGKGHGVSTCPLLPYREYVKFEVDEGMDDFSD